MTKTFFQFDAEHYDFWPLYETIREYYPIGIQKNEINNCYRDFKGLKKYEELLVKNIHNQQEFQAKWGDFSDSLEDVFQKKVIGSTMGQEPSINGRIIFEEEDFDSVIHLKELNFAISLLGPYFQIFATDKTILFGETPNRKYSTTNIVTVSPVGQMSEPFMVLARMIKSHFGDFKLVPFSLGQMIIQGLQLPYSDSEECTVNMALFNNVLENISECHILGDRHFDMQEWQIKPREGEGMIN
ncbi:MAG: hypothetical protein DWQ02_06840 [Bacteroidetes bacterium]|nr:MAG: hypothetical protein DWQ02_06840 [Bacteroidota bacterium]